MRKDTKVSLHLSNSGNIKHIENPYKMDELFYLTVGSFYCSQFYVGLNALVLFDYK